MQRFVSLSILLALIGSLALAGCSTGTRTTSSTPKPYPFTTCVVGGEKLGSMGPVLTEVKDGYEVKFCCAECQAKFDKMPTKHMEKIKAAFIDMPQTGG